MLVRELVVFILSALLFMGVFISASYQFQLTKYTCIALLIGTIVSGHSSLLWRFAVGTLKMLAIYIALMLAITAVEGGAYGSLSWGQFVQGYRQHYWFLRLEAVARDLY